MGIGSSLRQKSHRYRNATFIQLGSGAMVSVEQANEIVAKLRELDTEQKIMKDLFNRALRMSQSGSDVKLNFREEERHMPGMFNGKSTECTEYIFKMDAYLSTLDPAGKRVKSSEPTRQKPRTWTVTRTSQQSIGTCQH